MITQRLFLTLFFYGVMIVLPWIMVFYYDKHLQESTTDAIFLWYIYFVLARGVVGVASDWWLCVKEEYDRVMGGYGEQ